MIKFVIETETVCFFLLVRTFSVMISLLIVVMKDLTTYQNSLYLWTRLEPGDIILNMLNTLTILSELSTVSDFLRLRGSF